MLTFKEFQQEEWGRLGNQLFQIATLVGLGKRYGHQIVLPCWDYSEYFQLNGVVFDLSILDKPISMILSEVGAWSYAPEELSALFQSSNQDSFISLAGYFQNTQYFENSVEEIVTEIFAFTSRYEHFVQSSFPDLSQMCAIHVRRGDYLVHRGVPLLSMVYYEEAIQCIQNKTGCTDFIVFSDDILWCKKKFKNFSGNFCFSENRSEIEDLWAMSKCEYHIISNSTFAWWGSYLAQSKLVIVPPLWFNWDLRAFQTVKKGLLSHYNMLYLHEKEEKIRFFSYLAMLEKRWDIIVWSYLKRFPKRCLNKLKKLFNIDKA